MSNIRAKSEKIRNFILENVDTRSSNITKITAEKFDITRQAVNKHLQSLVQANALEEITQGKNKTYKLVATLAWNKIYEITPELAEDIVWRQDIRPLLGQIPGNLLNIWQYGFTEMFNNAIDHSEGANIIVNVKKTAINTEISISDDGIGIFKKIQTNLNLLDESHAVFELAKGKLTTDPARHTGQGIFFSSRAFDTFIIYSGTVFFTHEYNEKEDWILASQDPLNKTIVNMKLSNHAARILKNIFNQYASAKDDYGFNKTVVPVKLAQYGNEQLISRSQAKRLLARVELFKIVILDFNGVASIGQAFADEIFRVFSSAHPEIALKVLNENADVKQMIARANPAVN